MRLIFNILLTVYSCMSVKVLQAPMVTGINSKPYWVEHISRSIERLEGGLKPKTLPWRLNNPGALVFAKQNHAHRDMSGFARFDSRQYGKSAVRAIVDRRFEWGRPLSEIIKPWGNKAEKKIYVEAVRIETGWRGE